MSGTSSRRLRAALIGLACTAWIVAVAQALAAAQAPAPAPASIPASHTGSAFETADNCLACHNGMTTPSGEDASIGVSWRASMMANSARDPYWLASVRRETLDHPLKARAIEDECAICHMPMARTAAHEAGREGEIFRLLDPAAGDEHRMAVDGVSCTLCHQIGTERLGTRESFTGGFVLAPRRSDGPRMLGPYEVDRGLTRVMRSATGATPEKADHLRSSEMCATCHTLITEAFDAGGKVVGSLPEQVPYLEWRHSAFATERSCQACHMPDAADTPIASVLGEPRERMGRHTFLGGNFFMLRMLNANRAELGVVAPPAELDAAARATLRQLEADTATLSIERAAIEGGRLAVDLLVRNLTGHKLPTGYPSRRAWIHLTVRGPGGAAVFESGAITPAGRIQGNDNDADAGRYEPHYREITDAGQVQIYEAVMADVGGRVTTGLLRATSFVKDNRLLPRGFDPRTAPPDIAVRGEAGQDPDFTGDGDRVRYAIPLAGAGPFTVDVELRYQPIAFRWAENLRTYDAAEPRRFVGYYDRMAAASSAVLARAASQVR